MGSDSAHQDIVTAVIHLCSDSIRQFEGILNAQIESDKAAFEEMKKVKEKVRFVEQAAKEAVAEAARYAAEHVKKERERLAAMAHDDPTTTFTKRTWSATLDMGDDNDNESKNDEEEEDGNDSVGEEVRSTSFYSFILHSQHHIIILGDWQEDQARARERGPQQASTEEAQSGKWNHITYIRLLTSLNSYASSALVSMRKCVSVQSDRPAMSAGSRRNAAWTVVCIPLSIPTLLPTTADTIA